MQTIVTELSSHACVMGKQCDVYQDLCRQQNDSGKWKRERRLPMLVKLVMTYEYDMSVVM